MRYMALLLSLPPFLFFAFPSDNYEHSDITNQDSFKNRVKFLTVLRFASSREKDTVLEKQGELRTAEQIVNTLHLS